MIKKLRPLKSIRDRWTRFQCWRLVCTDLRGEEWLKDLVAGIEIVNQQEITRG